MTRTARLLPRPRYLLQLLAAYLLFASAAGLIALLISGLIARPGPTAWFCFGLLIGIIGCAAAQRYAGRAPRTLSQWRSRISQFFAEQQP